MKPGGNVGTAIIQELLKDPKFRLTAITRPTSKYQPPLTSPSSNIKVIVADHNDRSSLAKALQHQDALVNCVPGGATDFESQKMVIDAAIEAGVKLFFASEYSADIMGPLYQRFPTKVVGDKVKIRRYLMEKAAAGEIAYTALNGGPFFDMCKSHTTPGEVSILNVIKTFETDRTANKLGLRKGVAGFDIPARKATI